MQANKVSAPERPWVEIKGIPARLIHIDAQLALGFLLSRADRVEMQEFPKDQSRYRAYFDDGAYKGCFEFTWTENGLTPLKVYEKLQATGWPGFSMGWMKQAACDQMRKELRMKA